FETLMNHLYTRVTLLLGAALLFLPMQATAQNVSKAPTFRAHSSPQTVFSPRSGEIVFDGSFEEGSPNPVWEEASTNFGTPLCAVGSCGSNPAFVPHTGDWWAWFGGIDA